MEVSNNNNNNKPITVNLFCPSLSKLVELVAWKEQKLDIGSISMAFGLDPSTVKINGHFISRGVDLVSSSLTWRSLLSFFSARGLSRGEDDKDPLIVDGKLCKVGTKKAHDPQVAVNVACKETESKEIGISGRSLPEDHDLVKNKRLRDSTAGELNSRCGSSTSEERDHPATKYNDGHGFKRKNSFEDLPLLKKLKINESDPDIQGRENNDHTKNIARNPCTCSYLSENMKRTRDDEVIVAAPCKRIK